MFGDKRLEMPKDVDSCRIIMHNFNMVWPDSTSDLMHNAKRLVELNNAVYDKLHSCEYCKTRYPGIETSDYCRMCNMRKRV
jgi:hypothetical protein